MSRTLRTAAVLAPLLANGACAARPTAPVFDPDPMIHAPVEVRLRRSSMRDCIGIREMVSQGRRTCSIP